jgi:hypothetical protein
MQLPDFFCRLTVALSASVFLISCGGGDLTVPTTTGTVELTTSTTGSDQDPDGYSIRIDAGAAQEIGASGKFTSPELSPGNHTVELGGLAANCAVDGENPRTVIVAAGEATKIDFLVTCSSTTGSLTVTTATSGSTSDPDGYNISLDGSDGGALGVSGTMTITGLIPGNHLVGLSGLAANCQIQGDNLQVVAISAGATASLEYTVVCSPPPPNPGTLRITTTTNGLNPDPDGYTYAVDGGSANPIGVNATATIPNVAPGAHSVRIAGLASNCTVAGSNPQSVTINSGSSTDLNVVITCTATVGSVRVSVTSSGSPADPDGYLFAIDQGQTSAIGINDQQTVPGISPGTHAVTLSGIAENCRADELSKNVTVTAGATATAAFTITCTPPSPTVGTIHVTTTTTGSQPDPNGYTFTVDGGRGQPIGATEGKDVVNVPAGDHSVVLSGVAENCRVDDDSQNVTVTAGGTATVAFAITCDATTGTIHVTTTTSGTDQDNDFSFAIDNGGAQPISGNQSKDVSAAVGQHTVVLSGVASNCTVDDPSQEVSVTGGGTANVTFTITCAAIPPEVGTIHVTTTTSGDNQDADGYTFTVDNGAGQPIGTTDAKDVPNVPVGKHKVVLSGLADNCRIGDAPKDVDVRSGQTVNAAFTISCESTGPSATKSTMAANPKNMFVGESSTITVSVRTESNAPVANTTVTLSSNGTGDTFTPTSVTTDASGVATFTFSSTVAGDKTITATAGGVTLNDTEVITVSRRTSTTTITSVQPEPSTAGSSIHVTVQVTGTGGGTPTGTVAIFSTSETAGCDAAPLDAAGNAVCDFVLSQPGDQTISATYSGDGQFLDSSDPDGAPHTVTPTE